MAYFTFEDAWLEPSQTLDICFNPEQSFQSDSERDVFQQLLYLRVPHQKEFNRVFSSMLRRAISYFLT